MSDIKLITPPDKIYDRSFNILLIEASDAVKFQLQHIIKDSKLYYNIYIYDINSNDEDRHYNWLFDLHLIADITIVELDNMPKDLKCIESYLISFPNTYWITQGENALYNKISSNRIFTLEQIKAHIGEYVEIS
jgi:hypothetical protein